MPVARYSVCEIGWHRWQQPVVYFLFFFLFFNLKGSFLKSLLILSMGGRILLYMDGKYGNNAAVEQVLTSRSV